MILLDGVILTDQWLHLYGARYPSLAVCPLDGPQHTDAFLPISAIPTPYGDVSVDAESLMQHVATFHLSDIKHIIDVEAVPSLIAWLHMQWDLVIAGARDDATMHEALSDVHHQLEVSESFSDEAYAVLTQSLWNALFELHFDQEMVDFMNEWLERHSLGVENLIDRSLQTPMATVRSTHKLAVLRLKREVAKFEAEKVRIMEQRQQDCLRAGEDCVEKVKASISEIGEVNPFSPSLLQLDDWNTLEEELTELAQRCGHNCVGASLLTLFDPSLNRNPMGVALHFPSLSIETQLRARLCHLGASFYGQLSPTFNKPSSWQLLFS